MIRFSHHRTYRESLCEYGRGIAGGLMFSIPLLYTSEVWWAGFLLEPWRIAVYGAATFALLMLYNRFAGLRRDASLAEVAIDSVEEMGIGLLLSALILWLTGRLGGGMDPLEMIGMTSVETMTVAIGVSVGTAQLGAPDDGDDGMSGDGSEEREDDGDDPAAYLPQAALALCGAVLFAANVAPTEEITIIAAESPPEKLLLIALFSMLLAGLIFYFAGFRGADRFIHRDGWLLVARGIVTTYAISLVASAGLLWFFGRLDREPPMQFLAMTVVLGLPAVLGASAGRLLLQGSGKSSSRKEA